MIKIDMTTLKTLDESSVEYNGNVALCCGGGGTTVMPPEKTEQEIELDRLKLEAVKLEKEESAAMKPYILKGMGLTEEDGKLRYMTEEERIVGMSEIELSTYNLTKLQQERQAQAFAGEIPVSPAFTAKREKAKAQMEENLSRRLGLNWKLTTPGQQAMSTFEKDYNIVEEGLRRAEMTEGGANILQNLGYLGGSRIQKTEGARHFPSRTGGLFARYGEAGATDRYYNKLKLQANMANAQAEAQRSAGLWGGIGSLAGAGMQAGALYAGLAASSRILKKNIKTIKNSIKKIMAIRGVEFDWKENALDLSDDFNGHDIGVVAEELEEIMPEAVPVIRGYKHVEYYKIIPLLVEGIKNLQCEISKLKEKK